MNAILTDKRQIATYERLTLPDNWSLHFHLLSCNIIARAAFNLENNMTRFQYITRTATACKNSWSNIDKIRFHAFNPNGIMYQRIKSNDRIRALVDTGFAKPGVMIAYGSLCNYHTDKLIELTRKGRATRHEATYYAEMIAREISAADAFIDSIAACI